MAISAFFSYFTRSTLSAPIDILPTEILSHILVSAVPYEYHSTCSKVCRKWKEILDTYTQLLPNYVKHIKSCIEISKWLVVSLDEIANQLSINSEHYWKSLDITSNITRTIGAFNPWIYYRIHILNGSFNYKWIVEKFEPIRISFNAPQNQEKINKAIKIYNSSVAKYNNENKRLINGFLRNAIENICSPSILFEEQHCIHTFHSLIFYIDAFIKENIFKSNKQFVCLFTHPICFLRLVTDHILTEPKHFLDDLDVKLILLLDKKAKFTEIKINIPRGKWYVFLHGYIPESWYEGIVKCCNSAAISQTLLRQEQKANKRALEIEHQIDFLQPINDSEPILKKARNLFSSFFK